MTLENLGIVLMFFTVCCFKVEATPTIDNCLFCKVAVGAVIDSPYLFKVTSMLTKGTHKQVH